MGHRFLDRHFLQGHPRPKALLYFSLLSYISHPLASTVVLSLGAGRSLSYLSSFRDPPPAGSQAKHMTKVSRAISFHSRWRFSCGTSKAQSARLSSSEGRRRYLFEIPGADPADAARGQPGYRGDAAPGEAIALSHVLYLLGPLPADPLAPTEVLASSSYPLQPCQCPLPGPGLAPSQRRRWPGAASPAPWRCPDLWTLGD